MTLIQARWRLRRPRLVRPLRATSSGRRARETPTDSEKGSFLHTVICELEAADVWNIVLTPNYNADHRNHFHVDLTNGSDFIKRSIGVSDASFFGDQLSNAGAVFADR